MKRTLTAFLGAVVFAAFASFGARTVSAAPSPASTQKGTGCYVAADGVDYYYDAGCAVHLVFDIDADGDLVFYEYQDHGQIPAGVARPSRAVRRTFEQCLNFGSLGVLCGIAVEVVTPSGQYKSSITIRP